MLYKQGDVSALAVVLGAQSLDDAVTRLDDLNSVADQSQQVVADDRNAQLAARAPARTLARSAARDRRRTSQTRSRRRMRSPRRAPTRVASSRGCAAQQRLKAAQIHALEATRSARRAQVARRSRRRPRDRSTRRSSATPHPSSAPAPAAGRTLTVSSTGYSLPGPHGDRLPVGWGVVAVDPVRDPARDAPDDPRLRRGCGCRHRQRRPRRHIDLWFPTLAQARAWGRRTVTITLH